MKPYKIVILAVLVLVIIILSYIQFSNLSRNKADFEKVFSEQDDNVSQGEEEADAGAAYEV